MPESTKKSVVENDAAEASTSDVKKEAPPAAASDSNDEPIEQSDSGSLPRTLSLASSRRRQNSAVYPTMPPLVAQEQVRQQP